MASLRLYSPCELHVPYKRWADDPREAENYEAIEQWSVRLQNCLTASSTPPPPPTLTSHRMVFSGVNLNLPLNATVTLPLSTASQTHIYGSALYLIGNDVYTHKQGWMMWGGGFDTAGTVNQPEIVLSHSVFDIVGGGDATSPQLSTNDRRFDGWNPRFSVGGGFFVPVGPAIRSTLQQTSISGGVSIQTWALTVSLVEVT